MCGSTVHYNYRTSSHSLLTVTEVPFFKMIEENYMLAKIASVGIGSVASPSTFEGEEPKVFLLVTEGKGRVHFNCYNV